MDLDLLTFCREILALNKQFEAKNVNMALLAKSRVYLYTVKLVSTGETIQFEGKGLMDIKDKRVTSLNQIIYVHKELVK